MFDCKIYVLLKKSNASARAEKMKSRAFVSYLVEYNSINIFRVWNSEKSDVSKYRDVIFDEKKFYDIYNKNKKNLIIESKKKKYVLFRTYAIWLAIDIVDLLNNDEEEWLKTFVRKRLVLKNSIAEENLKRSFSKRSIMKKSINQKNDSVQLSTLFESSWSQLILRQFNLTEDKRISRFQLEDTEDAVDLSNVTVRRKNKEKKISILLETNHTSLDVTDFQIDLKSVKNIESVDLNETQILNEKRTRKSTNRYLTEKYT